MIPAHAQVDPEGYVRAMDVESSPDADTPRPCGVALLLCMLERGGEGVAAVMAQLAAQLQAQPPSPTNLLLREATYRCGPHLKFMAEGLLLGPLRVELGGCSSAAGAAALGHQAAAAGGHLQVRSLLDL